MTSTPDDDFKEFLKTLKPRNPELPQTIYETTRLYTRDGIKTIDYEVHLKLQHHCDELDQKILDLEDKLKRAQESIRHKTKVIKEINLRLEPLSLETDSLKSRAEVCRLIGNIHNFLKK